jgi:glycosyltransferase involved in cell wall biosynthesis
VNLLVFNLMMDATHPGLGHTTRWTNELARRAEHVSVITMSVGELALERNVTVHSLGKERGWSEPRRLAAFYRLTHQVLSEHRIDACFAHMTPLFAVLFAPVARRHGIPILLWYAHSSVTRRLRLAHAVADRCVTASPASFPFPSDKVFAVGHGIDTDAFQPPAQVDGDYWGTAISVGRITPVKRIDEMLEAVGLLATEHGLDLRLHLVGGPATSSDEQYMTTLRRRASALDIDHLVTFRGTVQFPEVPAQYHSGALFLNLSGSALDKAILEGMAAGCVPISRNPPFVELARQHDLRWLVPEQGASGLADRISTVLTRSRSEHPELVSRLRRVVTEGHSMTTLGDRVMHHLHELADSSGGGRNRSR